MKKNFIQKAFSMKSFLLAVFVLLFISPCLTNEEDVDMMVAADIEEMSAAAEGILQKIRVKMEYTNQASDMCKFSPNEPHDIMMSMVNVEKRNTKLRALRQLHSNGSVLLNQIEAEVERLNNAKNETERVIRDFGTRLPQLKTRAETKIKELVSVEQAKTLVLLFSTKTERLRREIDKAINDAWKWTQFRSENFRKKRDHMASEIKQVIGHIESMIKKVKDENSKLMKDTGDEMIQVLSNGSRAEFDAKAAQFRTEFESNLTLWEVDIERLASQVVELSKVTTSMTVELDANDKVRVLERVVANKTREMGDDVDCFVALASEKDHPPAYGTLEEMLKDMISEASGFNLTTYDYMDAFYNKGDADLEDQMLGNSSNWLLVLKEEVLAKLPKHNVTMQELLGSTFSNNDSTPAMITASEIYARRYVLEQLINTHQFKDIREWYKCDPIGTIKQKLTNRTRESLGLVKAIHDLMATLHSHHLVKNVQLLWTKYQEAATIMGNFPSIMVQHATLCSYLSKLAESLDETKDHSTLCLYECMTKFKHNDIQHFSDSLSKEFESFFMAQHNFVPASTLCEAFFKTQIQAKLEPYKSLFSKDAAKTTIWTLISQASSVSLLLLWILWCLEILVCILHCDPEVKFLTGIAIWLFGSIRVLSSYFPVLLPYEFWNLCVLRFIGLVVLTTSKETFEDFYHKWGEIFLIAAAISPSVFAVHMEKEIQFPMIGNFAISIIHFLLFIYYKFFMAASRPPSTVVVVLRMIGYLWCWSVLAFIIILLFPGTHILAIAGWLIYRKYRNGPVAERNGNTNKNTELVFDSDDDGSQNHPSAVLLSDAASSSKMVSKISSDEPPIPNIDASSACSSGGLVAGALSAIASIFLLTMA